MSGISNEDLYQLVAQNSCPGVQGALAKAQHDLQELQDYRDTRLAELEELNTAAAQPYDEARSPGFAAGIVMAGKQLDTAEYVSLSLPSAYLLFVFPPCPLKVRERGLY